MCYSLIGAVDKTVIWQKPLNTSCYRAREKQVPSFCHEDDPDNAW